MEMSVKKLKCLIVCAALVLLMGTTSVAEGETVNAGVYTGDEEISIYIKGLGNNIDTVECQIGKKTGQQVKFEKTGDMDIPAKTLIMIDNSLSITQQNREKIDSFLREYIYEKDKDELVAIATFSEKIDTITDYMADRRQIEDIIAAIEYNDQETYLTDVLYDAIKGECLGTEDCYKTIIIISDGVDSKSIGYTKDELYELIKKTHYPIYTLGCLYKSNNEQLENMFALSRMTGGLYYMLDDCEDMRSVADNIVDDNNAIHFAVKPGDELLDGSTKNILLTVGTGEGKASVNLEVRMPLKAEIYAAPVSELETEQETETETETESEIGSETRKNNMVLIIIIASASAVVLLTVIIVIIVVVRKRNKRNEFEVLPQAVQPSGAAHEEEDKTLLVRSAGRNNDDNSTQMIWNDCSRQYYLVLTDMKSPGKTLQTPINGSLIIGRKESEANLVIDYDKSVSGKHCQIREKNGKFYIRDLQSSNGTKVNDSFVLSEVEIYSGCKLTIGRLEMKVEIR